jgi:DNA/RNA-binding protein KIN17
MTDHVVATKLEKEGEVEFKLLDEEKKGDKKRRLRNAFGDEEEDEEDEAAAGGKGRGQSNSNAAGTANYKKPMSNLEEIALREMERRKKRSKEDRPPAAPAPTFGKDEWLTEGIIVKVMSKKLSGGEYYKKKGMVFEVHNNGAIGDVEMLDSQDAIRLASNQLETVIPSIGGRVIIVVGAHRGEEAILEKLNVERYSANVRVKRTKNVLELPYESICKLK